MVFPVLGTVLILVGARGRADPTRRLLSTRPAVYIGRISYSMYLWHWPMLLLARQWALRKGVDFNALPVLAAIFAVSSLSYHCVEVPTRHRRRAVVPILGPWGAQLSPPLVVLRMVVALPDPPTAKPRAVEPADPETAMPFRVSQFTP